MDDQAVVLASLIFGGIACLMAVIAILIRNTLFTPTVHQSWQARPTVGSRFGRNSIGTSSITTALNHVPPPLRGTPQFENIHVIDSDNWNKESTRELLRKLKSHCDEFPVLSFDCEWTNKQNSRGKVALLQLQSYNGLCVLIRLNLLEEVPSKLDEILFDDEIIKVGVAPDTDAKYLKEDHWLEVRSTFDLRYMAVWADCQPGTLAKMSEQYLNLRLKKGSDKALHFDWEVSKLSDKQKEYAAMDVHAAIELFKVFAERLEQVKSFPTDQDYVKCVITKHCSKFLNKYYNGAQGIPDDALM